MEDVDLSQLLAFADAVGDSWGSNSPTHTDWQPTQTWYIPQTVIGAHLSEFARIIRSVQPSDTGPLSYTDSPDSPIQKSRTALFKNSEIATEILPCGDSMDPRSVCIVDHPGRHAQFKHWIQAGMISEDAKRMTMRDEAAQGNSLAPRSSGGTLSASPSAGAGLLGIVNVGANADSKESESVLTLLQTLRKSVNPTGLPQAMSSGPAAWKGKSFLVGKNVMVAMADMEIDDSLFQSWCMWFNDMLCSWGLSERTWYIAQSSAAAVVTADIDFSRNQLTDHSIYELCQLLLAFRRVHVVTLRLASNTISDVGLAYLADLPYLHNVVLDDNQLSRQGIREFLLRSYRAKRDHYDALKAQDSPDDSLVRPIFVSIDGNYAARAMELIESLESEGLRVCCPDSTSCEPSGVCRIVGSACDIHLLGLGAQRGVSE